MSILGCVQTCKYGEMATEVSLFQDGAKGGHMAVPSDDRSDAGMRAGRLFDYIDYSAVGCASCTSTYFVL